MSQAGRFIKGTRVPLEKQIFSVKRPIPSSGVGVSRERLRTILFQLERIGLSLVRGSEYAVSRVKSHPERRVVLYSRMTLERVSRLSVKRHPPRNLGSDIVNILSLGDTARDMFALSTRK